MQKLVMTPAPGARCVRFVGDQLAFSLSFEGGAALRPGWQARLRTNLGRGETLRKETIHAHSEHLKLTGASWRDVSMQPAGDGRSWRFSVSLVEPGFYHAKCYAIDPEGRLHWPEGSDFGVSIHPDAYRTANTIYCAFPRMFGPTRELASTVEPATDKHVGVLDEKGYSVIPPSGKLRDLIAQLPHIVDTLGCRILHLLPVQPTPTTYARFGRFGSPYACEDLLAIDPALVVFDKRTTGIDQFRELTYATHARGAKVFLDIVINHTGWGSTLQERHPEWFLRDAGGTFISPGAWGTVWEDLVELETHDNPLLWEHLADVFLEWCRRGVDGFRCDAGYKIPVPAWRYITARVMEEFPETIFLLEGLGGSWEATENLLTEGGMQWAYSELFQNHSRQDVHGYLDYALEQSRRVGIYVHYSETHDNDRLAKVSRAWSLLRNRLCALTSVSGGFGFTCGVEWLAPEKINVHSSRGLAWGNAENIVPELGKLNELLSEHPAFFDSATLTRLSAPEDHVFAIRRVSDEGADQVLVLVNTDLAAPHTLTLDAKTFAELGAPHVDLLGQPAPAFSKTAGGAVEFKLQGGEVFCLSNAAKPRGLSGERYRELRALSAWAITQISRRVRVRDLSPFDWRRMAELVVGGAKQFLAAVSHLDPIRVREDVIAALEEALAKKPFPQVSLLDRHCLNRVNLVPHDHWLLIQDRTPFRVALHSAQGVPAHLSSIRVGDHHVACFTPGQTPGDAVLEGERYTTDHQRVSVPIRFLSEKLPATLEPLGGTDDLVLLTNGRGAMARLAVDVGRIFSKYDCLLGANLHSDLPVDRHVFAKRVRLWVNADGFISPLNADNLVEFIPGPPAQWRFVVSAGDERAVEILLAADMMKGRNTTVLHLRRPSSGLPFGRELPAECRVSITARVDIEDRNFHSETHHNSGADHHFNSNTLTLTDRPGFSFTPAPDRRLRVFSDRGAYHPSVEWSFGVAHPVEVTRGQAPSGDAFSPGWFELPLAKGDTVALVVTADSTDPLPDELRGCNDQRRASVSRAIEAAGLEANDRFGRQLAQAIRAFVVKRGTGRTVIAGYPWFLDWGRDSLICARGLIAAGMTEEVRQLIEVFARFEKDGTLPNTIHGADASNRDTSDAPLWFGVVCEELDARLAGETPRVAPLLGTVIDANGRSIADVLRSIAANCRRGTPNGIRMDPESALLWSPAHFTWMDTNYPAGTPREGYPVEIQVLWIRLLRQLARIGAPADGESWAELARRAEASLHGLFWLEEHGWLADVLLAGPGVSARASVADTALRSNCLFAVTLGLLSGDRAQRCVDAALRYLVVPGALRSLAPLPVSPPLTVLGHDGRPLNDPERPYCGRYEGDEDTRRKPAYHNGTAWTWTFPTFCEALALAWGRTPESLSAARSYLLSMDDLLLHGCLGQLPEIIDGDAPHTQRGCDAQAWGATEALRVWKLLNSQPS
jgi:starch synthase (maltosyl-transferring)